MGYGHIGDDNLHLNISVPKRNDELTNIIEPYVYEWTSSKKGSISAEHGLGVMKSEHLHYSKDSTSIDMMKRIKNVFDPNGILNPYKVLSDN
jgi:FAD/FMN-containing dehydrogenase